MLPIACTTEEKVPVTASPKTASGRPATLDGPIRVTVTSGDGTAVVTGDTTFDAVSGDVPGETDFLVEGDADLGAGQVLIQEVVRLTVGGAQAAAFGLTGGTPVPK